MKRRVTEISEGSEILNNGIYKEIESLNGILDSNKEVIEKLLSIRIPFGINKKYRKGQSIDQYNIETEKYITNITTHQGLDLHLQQHTKSTKQNEVHSPYSNPGYGIYISLLCAYHECFKKRPILNFPDADIELWNKQVKSHDLPLMNDMMNAHRDSYFYLHHPELFQKDNEGIYRIISPSKKDEKREDSGFGLRGDEAIFQFIDNFYQKKAIHKFIIEKELINLHLQAIIDVNRRVAGPTNNLNMKKISEVIYTILEDPEMRADSEKFNFRTRYEPL